jgi:hypothetical protein
MANRYGEAALMATRENGTAKEGQNGHVPIDPVARWRTAMEALYPTSPIARKKGGPRGAFLGLCEEGLVKGIPAGRYGASKDNKAYAVDAAALLIEGSQTWSTSALWRAVSSDPEKPHNSQMDVVQALWKNDLIVSK